VTQYIIRKALHEEGNDGWVWTTGYGSRVVVRITNPTNKRQVYCQVRALDNDFQRIYKDDPRKRRIPIVDEETIVMSQWYRDALGGFETTDKNNENGKVELSIKLCDKWWNHSWAMLRAAAHHPDI
jgi:hypothetical protein